MIPDGVDEIVPNVELYKELRDMEKRYDATILRKRLDVQDAVNRNVKVCLPRKRMMGREELIGNYGRITKPFEYSFPILRKTSHGRIPIAR